MKIVFINPPLLSPEEIEERERKYLDWIRKGNMYIKPFEPPFGIAALATWLSRYGYDVKVIDGTGSLLTLTDILSMIEQIKPQILGISTLTPNYPNAVILSKKIREYFPDITLFLGGVHPTIFPIEVLEECDANFVVMGEGEMIVTDLMRSLKFPPAMEIRRIVRSSRFLEPELIEFPDYNFLPVHNYITYTEKLRRMRALPAIVTRGCPYLCSFCAVGAIMGKMWRPMPAGKAAEKVVEIAEKFSLEGVWFKDSVLNLNSNWIDEFSLSLNTLLPRLRWQMNTRVDLIKENEIEVLAQRGLVQVDLGIEAGTNKSLRVLKKGITVEDVRRSVEILKKYHVKVAGFFMIGIPGEKEEDIWSTVNFARELELDSYSFSIFQPLPGSELFTLLVDKYGGRKIDWKKLLFTDTDFSWCEVPAQRLKEIYEQINDEISKLPS